MVVLIRTAHALMVQTRDSLQVVTSPHPFGRLSGGEVKPSGNHVRRLNADQPQTCKYCQHGLPRCSDEVHKTVP